MRVFLQSAVLLLALVATAAHGQQSDPLQHGLRLLASGQLDEARAALAAAVQQDPDDGRARLGLAEALRQSGDEDAAAQQIEAVAELAGDQPYLLRGLSVYFQTAGEPEQAAKFEGGYVRAYPDDPSGFIRAAALSLDAGRVKDAIEYARSGLDRKEDAALYALLGKAHALAGDDPAAEEALRNAIRLDPFDEGYRYDLGYLHLRAQRFEEALAAFDEGRRYFDKSPRIELGRGIAFYGLRRFDDALTTFLRAAELAPGVPQSHYFLGRMLEHAAGRVDQVVARQRAFAKLQPDNYLSAFLLAQALLALPEAGEQVEEEAEKLLRRSIELRPDFWESHFELGELLARQRRFEDARAPLERAVELNPETSKPHYRLARVYARLGETELAAQARDRHQKLTEAERQRMGEGMAAPALTEPPQ